MAASVAGRRGGIPRAHGVSLPDKPSIAVLSFKNMSGEAEQEYFADGLTDDLISDLSKISGLFVIARNRQCRPWSPRSRTRAGRARRGDHRPGQDRPAGEGGDLRIGSDPE